MTKRTALSVLVEPISEEGRVTFTRAGIDLKTVDDVPGQEVFRVEVKVNHDLASAQHLCLSAFRQFLPLVESREQGLTVHHDFDRAAVIRASIPWKPHGPSPVSAADVPIDVLTGLASASAAALSERSAARTGDQHPVDRRASWRRSKGIELALQTAFERAAERIKSRSAFPWYSHDTAPPVRLGRQRLQELPGRVLLSLLPSLWFLSSLFSPVGRDADRMAEAGGESITPGGGQG